MRVGENCVFFAGFATINVARAGWFTVTKGSQW